MTGHKPFSTLLDQMTPERRAKIEAGTEALRVEMNLTELRQARELTQAALGDVLQVGQAAIAKMEKRTDMYVSTVRRFVEAMGGELEIVAHFPDGNRVSITKFADLK